MLIVGGGPAGLAAAIRLASRQAASSRQQPLAIAVLEKARESGAHMLSGAVIDPSALDELVPDWRARGAPLDTPVCGDELRILTPRRAIRVPFVPPPLRNHGHYVISLNRFVRWLAQQAEAGGVDVLTGFSGAEVLLDAGRVVGVRTGDRGIDRAGRPKATFDPGTDIRARATIFADGVRGNLTKTLVGTFGLDAGRQPQVYAVGLKELWEVPADRLPAGTAIHTLGYPLPMTEFGGGFIYGMPDGLVAAGFVAGLDYRDPLFDPYGAFQDFKRHPFVAALLAGGRLVRYGAKALPEGGWHALPRCHLPGGVIVGDAAGFLNSVRLKGLHLAMYSGMHAADAVFEALGRDDTGAAALARFGQLVTEGPIRREMYPVRNVHQGFRAGLLGGLAHAGLALATGGWWFRDPVPSGPGHARLATLAARPRTAAGASALAGEKLESVHYSGTRHEEDQPSHLLVREPAICDTTCREEYGNPCTRFCPANVYEMIDAGGAGPRLKINASNCIHCKTCDIMDPYQIIDWVPPEGGGGPQYDGM